MVSKKQRSRKNNTRTSWDPVASWYDGWMGPEGSQHHRELAIPALLDILQPQPGEKVLDVGAGQGVLAPAIAEAHAHYTGVDVSHKLLALARRRHGRAGRFICGDARRLAALPELHAGEFDAVVFLLSIQNMDPLCPVLDSVAWALREDGRVVLLLTHPCFRVPRQSGWGWDAKRKLQYRRIDRYLTPLSVPMKAYPGKRRGVTLNFHRPLQTYINGLSECGLLVDYLRELPYTARTSEGDGKAKRLAAREVPLFLGLRAFKIDPSHKLLR